MTEQCEHVGKFHPIYFQCVDCEDTAYQCNCFSCAGVFCELCETMMWIECDEVVEAWTKEHPDEDLSSIGFREEAKIRLSKKVK